MMWAVHGMNPAVESDRERLHDRIRYRRTADGTWLRERLAP